MTDTAIAAPQGTPAPIVPPVIAAQPAAPIVPPVADDPAIVKIPSAKLKERLDESKALGAKEAVAQLAADLGVDIDTAKRIIGEAKAKDDAQKSEVQRLTEQLAAERAKLTEFDTYKGAVDAQAAEAMASLTDAQRAAVEGLAKSPPDRLKAIAALRPTWAAVAQAQADGAAQAKAAADKAAADAAAEAAKKAPVPAGATTAPATPPPAPATPGTPTNHHAVWQDLKVSNPAAAAMYRVKHEAAIRAAQRQATG